MPIPLSALPAARRIAMIGLLCASFTVPAALVAETAPSPARTVTVTYLQSQPGKLPELERFVRANWFAMDAIAVQQGLFVSYEWLDTGGDAAPWNALVIVTYADDKGFDGIADRWAPIKAGHEEVRPDGLGMKDLGRVLETKILFERSPFVSKRATPPPGP